MHFFVATILLTALLAFSDGASANPWEKVHRPSSQASASIGTYTNGCLSGAAEMPLRGEGFQLVRTGRDRHYGHPATIAFLKELSRSVARKGLGRLQIGDMSMARGGPFSSGHHSHQMGLDVDIWYSQDWRAAKRPLSAWERDNISAIPLADTQRHRLIKKNWDKRVPQILRLAAEDSRVARIFVHPTIKRKMCQMAGTDNEWLRKIRPWWGHNYHFHVRLACPEGDQYCKPQHPVRDDPCGPSLDWWFSKEFYARLHGTAPEKETPKEEVPEEPREPPPMPSQCKRVLAAP